MREVEESERKKGGRGESELWSTATPSFGVLRCL